MANRGDAEGNGEVEPRLLSGSVLGAAWLKFAGVEGRDAFVTDT